MPFPPTRPLIAVAVSVPPDAPGILSGVPAAVTRTLAELGCDVQPVWARADHMVVGASAVRTLSRTVLSGRVASRSSAGSARTAYNLTERVVDSRSAMISDHVRAHPEVDAYIQLSSDFEFPLGTTYATFEDQTVQQAVDAGIYEWIAMLTDHDRQEWLDRQTRIYEAADVCATRYHSASASIVGDYGIDPTRVCTVGPGTNRTIVPPAARDWSAPRFVTVGLDWERKNGARVVRAFGRLRREHPRAELHLIGEHPEGDEPGVIRHGKLSFGDPLAAATFRKVFERATCFVLPSLHDPGPISYLEAAHAGLPVIGSRVVGGNTITGENGTMVDPYSDDELLDAMRLLADPLQAQARGEALRIRTAPMTWKNSMWRLLHSIGIEAPGAIGEPPPLPSPDS